MKRKIILLPALLAASSIILGACAPKENIDDKVRLTYGNYGATETVKLNYSDLMAKMIDEESMIVATYEAEDTHCACWTILRGNLNRLVKEHHYRFYRVEYNEFKDQDNMGLIAIQDRPALNIIKNGKVVKKIAYSSNPEKNGIFKNYESLYEYILANTYKPNYYFMPALAKPRQEGVPNEISDECLDLHINNDETFIVVYYFESCGDCKYVFPQILAKYTQDKEFKIPMYAVNLQVEGIMLENNKYVNDKPEYIAYKADHFLSDTKNKEFGYNRGYVPTFHYYEKGELKDAAVFVNDTIEKVNNEWVVTDSFYTEERKSSLHYLDNVETTVIKGIKIPEKDLLPHGDKMAWDHDAASVYHRPLLEAFLNKYAI